jgi:hypothetical protein
LLLFYQHIKSIRTILKLKHKLLVSYIDFLLVASFIAVAVLTGGPTGGRKNPRGVLFCSPGKTGFSPKPVGVNLLKPA